MQEEIKGLQWTVKLKELSCWRNLGHRQLWRASNKVPKCHFVLDLLETPHGRSVDTTRNTTKNGVNTNTPDPPCLLPGANPCIAIAPEPDVPHGPVKAIYLHLCEPSRVDIGAIIAEEVAF